MTANNSDIYNSVSDMNSTADSISRLSIEATNDVCVSPASDNFNSRSITSPQTTSHLTPTHDTRDMTRTECDTTTDGVDINNTSGSPEQMEELCDRIRRQIEYYFSKENYWNDQYLLSQSDADQYVCLTTLATFPAVKNLSPDIEAIRLALKSSVQLEMDPTETKVRPNLKRCILILRDIPEDTSREDVEALFEGEGVPEVKGRVEYAINSNWYVRFDSETDAYTAYQFVINKTFNGRPIYPRIKSASTSVPNTSPELPAQYSPRPQYEQFSLYNYPAIPLPYMPPPIPSWGSMEPVMYPAGYLKPTLLVHRFMPLPRMLSPKSDYILASLPRNGSVEYTQTSPTNSRHHSSVATAESQKEQTGGDRGPRRRTAGRYPLKDEKRQERIPTPKMDADSFPPLPTSPGNTTAIWGPTSPQTPVEPTNKTLSDIVRKGPVGVSSPQQRHSPANPPPSVGRGRGRGVLPESPLEEVVERRKDLELEPNQKNTEGARTIGRGRKPKSQSTSESPTQLQTADQSRSRSESGDKEIFKSEKLSYAQMAQKLPPPPPPPLPEAATYLPPSPTLSDSPTTPSHSSQQLGFFKDTTDSVYNGCVGRGFAHVSQDSDTSRYSQRKPFVRVSNGPMNRAVRGYNGSNNSKLRKGVYPSSRPSRERRQIPQDRDSAFKDH